MIIDLKRVTKNRNGFTLIELMVVVVILAMITIGIVTFFGGGIRSWIAGQNQLKAQRDARMALERMVKEIREGEKFDKDSDENTVIVKFKDSFPKSEIKFSWSGNAGDDLIYIRNGATSPFLENVHYLNFAYMDKNGIEMNNKENASKVFINLQVDLDGDAKTGGNPDIILETEVSLRNYGREES